MNRKKREILNLVKYLIDIQLKQEHITKNKIDRFNFLKDFVKILDIRYTHGNKIKKHVKFLDKDKVLMRLKKSKYGYYRIKTEIKDIQEKDMIVLTTVLEYLNSEE